MNKKTKRKIKKRLLLVNYVGVASDEHIYEVKEEKLPRCGKKISLRTSNFDYNYSDHYRNVEISSIGDSGDDVSITVGDKSFNLQYDELEYLWLLLTAYDNSKEHKTIVSQYKKLK